MESNWIIVYEFYRSTTLFSFPLLSLVICWSGAYLQFPSILNLYMYLPGSRSFTKKCVGPFGVPTLLERLYWVSPKYLIISLGSTLFIFSPCQLLNSPQTSTTSPPNYHSNMYSILFNKFYYNYCCICMAS